MKEGVMKNRIPYSGRWSPQKSLVPLQQIAHFWRSPDHVPYELRSTPTGTQYHSRRSLMFTFIRKDASAFPASVRGRLQHFATCVFFFNMCDPA